MIVTGCILAPLVGALAALASSAPPQAPSDPPFPGHVHWYDMGEGPPQSARMYGPGQVMCFNPGPDRDYVALVDDQVVLWVDLAIHGARVLLSAEGNWLAAQPDFRVDGPQAIVVPGAGGLARYWYEGGQPTNEILGGIAWVEARFVAAGHLNQDQRWDFVGIAANGVDVLLLEQQSDGSFTPATGFSVPFSTLQLELLDFDDLLVGDGIREIALRHEDGVRVFRPDGSVRCNITTPHPTVTMTPIFDGGVNAQRLAVVTESPTGVHTLRIYAGDGTQLHARNLGPYRVVTMTSVDFHPQSDIDDLVLSLNSHAYLVMLSFIDFVMAPEMERIHVSDFVDMDVPAPYNKAVVAAGDVDRDGDLDLVYPCMDLENLYVFKNYTIDQVDYAPVFAHGLDNRNGTFELTWSLPELEYADAEVVRVSFWHKRGDPAYADLLPIESPEPYFVHTELLESLEGEFSLTLDLSDDLEDWEGGKLMLYAVSRVGKVEGELAANGPLTAGGPAWIEICLGEWSSLQQAIATNPWPLELQHDPVAFGGADPWPGSGSTNEPSVSPHPGDDTP